MLGNRTRSGAQQIFEDLVFHGGPGSTLEMRVFSRDDLLRHFTNAGFTSPRIYGEAAEQFGIVWDCQWSLPMAARWCS